MSSTQSPREIVVQALTRAFVDGDADSVRQFFGPTYIQHNPDVATGVEALEGLVGALAKNPDFKVETFRVLADGDLVATHSIYTGFAEVPLVSFDVFRVANGRIVEHWDNLSPVTQPNPSGRTQVDGATEITDLDATEANKAVVRNFVETVLVRGENVPLTDFVSGETYLQHNSQVADGIEGLVAFLQHLGEQGIAMRYTTLHKVIGEGNFVLTLSEGLFGDDAMAFYDLFRVEAGKIVEHWDVIAPMPGPDAPHNEDGKF